MQPGVVITGFASAAAEVLFEDSLIVFPVVGP